MSIEKAIREAFKQKKERGWDTIYFAIDLHSTILLPGNTARADDHPSAIANKIFPFALETLKLLSLQKDIVLILFTSSFKNDLIPFLTFCTINKINFKYLNENLECKNTSSGDYTKKFYYNVLLDDRAGFNPKHWQKIFNIIFEELECSICDRNKSPFVNYFVCRNKRNALLQKLRY